MRGCVLARLRSATSGRSTAPAAGALLLCPGQGQPTGVAILASGEHAMMSGLRWSTRKPQSRPGRPSRYVPAGPGSCGRQGAAGCSVASVAQLAWWRRYVCAGREESSRLHTLRHLAAVSCWMERSRGGGHWKRAPAMQRASRCSGRGGGGDVMAPPPSSDGAASTSTALSALSA